MLSLLRMHFSLLAVDSEARKDPRIYERSLGVFVKRETINSYLAQFIFALVALLGFYTHSAGVISIAIAHIVVDQWVRHNLEVFNLSLTRGHLDFGLLRRIEHIFYAVGFVWAVVAWPLTESLDGLRLLLSVTSAAGLIVMANTTCHAPRVFRAATVGYSLGVAAMAPVITAIPWYVLAGAGIAFIIVATAVGVGTARQLLQMLQMQVERDAAIETQERTISALDSARKVSARLAETDSLTGLANRFLLMTKLDELIAGQKTFSLTLLDIDLFKNINDALGHHTGDEVLKVLGNALTFFGNRAHFAARLGGDEFALITDRDHVEISGEEIISTLRTKMNGPREDDVDLPAISITGGSAYFPQDAGNSSDLLAAADIAQHEAKKSRPGGHLDYNASLSNTFLRETRIAQALVQSIASRELVLVFQPKINLQSGRIEGAEALSRFPSESLSGYPLDEVFAVAERRGIGTALDELVLDTYREVLVALRDEHAISLPTSVNLSGAILKTPERLLAKLNLLISCGLPPSLIRVEITENAIYGRGQNAVVDLLSQIARLGFSLALDDFGTGSGSLQHLASLPISEIKIDRSFVSTVHSDRKSGAIVKGLIVIGQAMGVEIVAEGVETEDQAELLRSMSAQFAQGYLWARPLPVPEFVAFVSAVETAPLRDVARERDGVH